MNKKNKIIIAAIIVAVIVVFSLVGTYAWYVWNTSDDEVKQIVTSVGAATIYYDSGSSITGVGIRPVSDKSKGIVKTIKVKTSTVTSSGPNFDLFLDVGTIDEDLKHESFKYAFYKSSTLITEGNFTQTHIDSVTTDCTVNAGAKHIQLLDDESISTSLTTYTLYIWIDGANYTNPNTMQDKNFNFTLHATGEDAIIREGEMPDISESTEGSLAYQLINLYNSSEKSDVSNNGIVYHYDTAHNLMSDIGGNLRYYGKSPNNYIYFNCSDYTNQSSSTCETWRIIGVFDGQLKIMRGSNIGTYAWDNKNVSTGAENAYGKNDWVDSRLVKLLNPGYESYVDYNNSLEEITANNSLYWNAGSGTCYAGQNNATKTCDFTSTGLKNDTTRNLVSDALWFLKGWNSSSVYSDQMYDYERSTGKVYSTIRPTSWVGKVALAYPSDYGYAADLSSCNVALGSYNNSLCTANNWMKSIYSSTSWLLTPYSGSSSNAWNVRSSGFVDSYGVYFACGVVPVLHLNSELGIVSGDGSSTLPYQLSVG